MSQQLINRSPDLKQLRDEGYGVTIRSQKYLLIDPVPYVTAEKTVAYGTLVCELNFNGNDLAPPADHVIHFIGEYPCDAAGVAIDKIFNASQHKDLAADVTIDHTFSARPTKPFTNYYEKVSAYVTRLTGQAEVIDSAVTARTFPVVESPEEESVFRYIDTASSRAQIDAVSAKLARGKIAIVGLGGTGSYVLDFVAKTPVKEIHLFDADVFSQHNAFRCPGAPSIDELKAHAKKAVFWRDKYNNMHRHVVAHDTFVDESNLAVLDEMDFVFLSLDQGVAKAAIIRHLDERNKPFVDVGMGLYVAESTLQGLVRTTTSTVEKRDHVPSRIPLGGDGGHNDYARNIQIADLNALNAALAVIKWKKLWGFYGDTEREYFSIYAVAGNVLINEDQLP